MKSYMLYFVAAGLAALAALITAVREPEPLRLIVLSVAAAALAWQGVREKRKNASLV